MASEDLENITSVLSGDAEAYAALVNRHSKKIFGLCYFLLNNKTEAEEVVQETFIKAYFSLASYRGDSSFRSWLSRIASHACYDLLRSAKKHPQTSWDDFIASKQNELGVSEEKLPFTKQLENTDLVREILNHLSLEHRHILTLRELQDFSYEEIAKTLECSIDAVKARLQRARHELELLARDFKKESL